MNAISEQAPKSIVASPLGKLCRMLQNMLRRYPQARLWTTKDGFGVSLDAATYVVVSYSGNWSDEAMRDCHALFATWYVAAPAALRMEGRHLAGVLQAAKEELSRSSTPLE
jgi:hypothetical protein